MKTLKLFAILIAFSKLTFAQDVSYNTVKTTATAQNNQTSITIMGTNNNEGQQAQEIYHLSLQQLVKPKFRLIELMVGDQYWSF